MPDVGRSPMIDGSAVHLNGRRRLRRSPAGPSPIGRESSLSHRQASGRPIYRPFLPTRPGADRASGGPNQPVSVVTTGLLSDPNAETPRNRVANHYRILPAWSPK